MNPGELARLRNRLADAEAEYDKADSAFIDATDPSRASDAVMMAACRRMAHAENDLAEARNALMRAEVFLAHGVVVTAGAGGTA